MKHLLTLLAILTLLAAPAAAQTIKSLGYNTTNGQIVAATNVVWTNAFSFSTNTVAAQVRTNLLLGASWLTNSNATSFRAAIGIDYTYGMFGGNNDATLEIINEEQNEISLTYRTNETDVYGVAFLPSAVRFGSAISFSTTGASGATRTNLGLPLSALTNPSNVTMMRALSGSTNTNHPFSGTVSVVGTNNTNTLVFSNGILQSVQ